MTKHEFGNKYLENTFFWINKKNHRKIQIIMQEFGITTRIGEGFINWHEGFNNLCIFAPDEFTNHAYYSKVDVWLPNASYGNPVDINDFFSDYKTITNKVRS